MELKATLASEASSIRLAKRILLAPGLVLFHILARSACGFGPDADADDRTRSVGSTTGLAHNNNGYFRCPISDKPNAFTKKKALKSASASYI